MAISVHTKNSGIIRDVLAELSKDGMDEKYICGGIAVQFYLPEDLHRRTFDIDIESTKRIVSGNFHDYIERIAQPLVDRGYSFSFSKARQTYDALLKRDTQRTVIQMPRRSVKKFEEVKPRIEREYSESLRFPYVGGFLRIESPNDLIVDKLGRADVFRRAYVLEAPVDMGVSEGIERADLMKANLDIENLDPNEMPRKIAYIRMLADIADVKAIASNAQVSEHYIRQALKDFPTRDSRSLENLFDEVLSSVPFNH